MMRRIAATAIVMLLLPLFAICELLSLPDSPHDSYLKF